MNLNHEIINFQDIDYNNSILCMRMMLKSDTVIKRYKIYELKIKDLPIQNKGKKILDFPFKSKLTFNYTLSKDKTSITNFIKEIQEKKVDKKQKSIFEQNFDDDDNMQEESENSEEIKNGKDNSSNASKNGKNNNAMKVENKKNDFKLRLNMFEKAGDTKKNNVNNTQPNKTKTNSKFINEKINGLKLDTNKSDNNIKKENVVTKSNTNSNININKFAGNNNKKENTNINTCNTFLGSINKKENTNTNINTSNTFVGSINKKENANINTCNTFVGSNKAKDIINSFNNKINIFSGKNNKTETTKKEESLKKNETIKKNEVFEKFENNNQKNEIINKFEKNNINNNKNETIKKNENQNKIKENNINNKNEIIKKKEKQNEIIENTNNNKNEILKKNENQNKFLEKINNFEKNKSESIKKNDNKNSFLEKINNFEKNKTETIKKTDNKNTFLDKINNFEKNKNEDIKKNDNKNQNIGNFGSKENEKIKKTENKNENIGNSGSKENEKIKKNQNQIKENINNNNKNENTKKNENKNKFLEKINNFEKNKTENIKNNDNKNKFIDKINNFEKNKNENKNENIKKNDNKNKFMEKINNFEKNKNESNKKIENQNENIENINNEENEIINKDENIENINNEEEINNKENIENINSEENEIINKDENQNENIENINNEENEIINKYEEPNQIKENINDNKNKNIKKNENQNKFLEKINNFEKNKNEDFKKNENQNKFIEKINNFDKNKNENIKTIDNKNTISENINNFEKNKSEPNKIILNNNNINNKSENTKKIDKNNKSEIIKKMENSKTVNPKKSETLKKEETNKPNPISKDDNYVKKDNPKKNTKNNLYKSEFMLKNKIINLDEEYNLDSFCNSFFICSFPYNNGKIMENSCRYRSLCNHAICCKLLAMEPEIVYKYPVGDDNDLELNNLSASICFPIGIKICYNQDRRSIYKSFSTHILNQQGQKYYMTIYHFYRQLDSVRFNKLYSDDPLKLYLRQFGDNTYKNKAEKEQLEKDLEDCQELAFREFVYIPYAIVLVSKYPYINQMRSCLNIIYKILTNYKNIMDNLEENIKSSLINKLLSYLIYGIPIPNANYEISFNVPLSLNKIRISSPFKNNMRNIDYINFSYILARFCPENIIKIFQLMLFEHKLLFIDKDNNRLSTVIDSFLNILYPIDWANTVIPIMSDQMTRYLQTFLPFINGISEDLFLNGVETAIKEAEEGIFQIYILNDSIRYSKPNNEDDIFSSIPKLPNEIYKKLYSELSDLSEAYKELNEKEKEKYCENINNIFKNIFLETICVMIYGLMKYIINNKKDYNGINMKTLNKIYGKDAQFYKDLTETQIFQNFIKNLITREKDYSLFFSMLKNITEKYIKSSENYKFVWKKTIRKLDLKDIQQVPMIFKIPIHLLNQEENLYANYIIEKPEWNNINKTIKNNNENDSNILSNEIIQESERLATKMFPINNKLNTPNDKIERYLLPGENLDDSSISRGSRMTTFYMNNTHSEQFEKLLELNYVKANDYIRDESDITQEEQEKIKKNFKVTITNLLKNSPKPIDHCLNNVYYSFGRDALARYFYQKGFKVVKKLNDECFNSLKQICINAFIAINNLEENQNLLEFAVKITSSAFCYCKENDSNVFLIDEIRNKLGKEYIFWNKKTFWNAWQHLENYFTINEYGIYCQVIVHDFVNKLLKLKLDKEFIENYIISALAEKMILVEHTSKINQNTIKENQTLFVENRTIIMDYINDYKY